MIKDMQAVSSYHSHDMLCSTACAVFIIIANVYARQLYKAGISLFYTTDTIAV